MKEKQITTKSRTARQNRTFRLSDYESRKLSEGIVYKYSADMLDEFIRLEAVSKDKKSEQREEADIILQRDYENKGKSR